MQQLHVFVSGHRPKRLCNSYDTYHPFRIKLRKLITAALKDVYNASRASGYEVSINCGFALGFDIDCASVAYHLGIPYNAYLAGSWQSEPWSSFDKKLYSMLLNKADNVVVAENKYSNLNRKALFIKRDQLLVEDSSSGIVFFDGHESGGTYKTICMADRMNRPVINLYEELTE